MRSKGRIWMWLVLCALLAPLQGRAAQIDDLFKQAEQAAASNNPFESARLYCQVADMDPTYKNAKMMCKVMKDVVKKEDDRCDERYANAAADVDLKKFDDAEQKLRNVKPGCRKYAESQDLLKKIAGLRANATNEAAAQQKYDDGMKAYNRNDFAGAKAALGAVASGTSTRSGDAQTQLNRIKQYEQAFAQGDQLEKASNLKAAIDAFNEAAKWKSDGPGDPRSRAQNLQTRLAAQLGEERRKQEEALRRSKPPTLALRVSPNSGQAALTVTATANATAQDGGTSIAGQRIQWGDGTETKGGSGTHVYKNPGTYDVIAWVTDDAGKTINQVQSVHVIEAAVKQVVPEVDVEKTLAEARAAKAKGNVALARGKYMKVLTVDKNNSEAAAALEELSKQATAAPAPPAPEPQTPGVISDSDQLLAQGITEYYTGNFDDAYSDLKNYLKFKGEKAGLANFYLGVLKATQYYLGGANKHELAEAANESFRAAKKGPKFKVPEKYISPKIVKMYTEGPGM